MSYEYHSELLQVLKELPREDLELYAFGSALVLARLLRETSDDMQVELEWVGSEYMTDRMSAVSAKVRQRVIELSGEKN